MNQVRLNVDAVSTVARTVALRSWTNEQVDGDLRETLDACLSVIGSAATMAWFRREKVTLAHAVPSSPVSELRLHEIAALLFRDNPDAPLVQREVEGLHVIAVPIRESLTFTQSTSKRELLGYAALCFTTGTCPFTKRGELAAAQSIAALLFQVLQNRARLFLPFSPRLAARYWVDSGRDGNDRLTPPFHDERETVTLGFDLRKSTFCMANAKNLTEFAGWLNQLVRILMSITHLYGGVFDKFTGDGILAHFLTDASAALDRRNAVASAVSCAVAMQYAAELHLQHLKLRFLTDVVGGAIGIDSAPAHWSFDHRHNPITIGPGVVNACRLMDDAKRGGILLTNLAFLEVQDEQWKHLFYKTEFKSKELKKEMGSFVWQLQTTSFPFEDVQKIHALCTAVRANRTFDFDE